MQTRRNFKSSALLAQTTQERQQLLSHRGRWEREKWRHLNRLLFGLRPRQNQYVFRLHCIGFDMYSFAHTLGLCLAGYAIRTGSAGFLLRGVGFRTEFVVVLTHFLRNQAGISDIYDEKSPQNEIAGRRKYRLAILDKSKTDIIRSDYQRLSIHFRRLRDSHDL